MKHETRVALDQPHPLNLSIEGAPGDTYIVELTGSNGVTRPVPFTVTASTAHTGNLILKVLPATLDPPVSGSGQGRLANSVLITDLISGTQIPVPEIASLTAAWNLGLREILHTDTN